MDLLFKRYASPYFLLDQMISIGGFSDFVQDLFDRTEEERLWEFFRHKVRDQSFEEFKGALNDQKQSKVSNEMMSKTQIETTVKDTFDIMQGFIPDDL